MSIRFAPFKFSLLPARFFILALLIITSTYLEQYFFAPCRRIDPNFIIPFQIIWGFFSIIWIYTYIFVCWLDAGALINDIRQYLKTNSNEKFKYLKRCEKCKLPKPERTHHCSKCNKCYVLFDHHCPWVGNCIAYRNSQQFTIFLIYSTLMLGFLSLISFSANFFYSPLSGSIGAFLGIVYAVFTYCVFSLTRMAIDDEINQRTTYERIFSKDQTSHKNNLKKPIWQWILPKFSPSTGLSF